MLTIRLQRIGKNKKPTYRLVISEKARDPQDRYLENLGTYNPFLKENSFQPKTERINYWLSKGAQTSNTIHNLLVVNQVIKGEKKRSVYLSKKRKTKVAEKKKVATPAA